MRYREGGSLDTSGVQDRRGAAAAGAGRRPRASPSAAAGSALVGLVVVVLIQVLGGGGGDAGAALGGLGGLGQGEQADNSRARAGLRRQRRRQHLGRLRRRRRHRVDPGLLDGAARRPVRPHRHRLLLRARCRPAAAAASSGSGPFYCPADQLVYIDLSFFDQLQQQFGAQGGLFVNAYVIAHEYGHHVQNLLGTNQQVHAGRDRARPAAPCGSSCRRTATPAPGPTTRRRCPTSPAQPLIAEITQDDIDRALDAAGRIGDDFIQREPGRRPGRPGRLHPRLVRAAAAVVH